MDREELEMKDGQQRYKTIKPGIQLDNWTGKIRANKTVAGRQYSRTFPNIKRAEMWRRVFVPDNSPVPFGESLGEVWQKYKQDQIGTKKWGLATIETRLKIVKFWEELFHLGIGEIDGDMISKYLYQKKSEAMASVCNKRQTFKHEVKLLQAIFNWYREQGNSSFVSPILKRHKNVVVRKLEKREKKMTQEEVSSFFDSLEKEDGPWAELAQVQFYIGGRIQEAAGLRPIDINFETGEVKVRNVCVWSRDTNKLIDFKRPKNGEERTAMLPPYLRKALKKRAAQLPDQSDLIFKHRGRGLEYRQIQYRYEKALERVGLRERFGGSHFIRHTASHILYNTTGSIEHVRGLTGHKTEAMARHYAGENKWLVRESSRALFERMGVHEQT